MNPVIDIDRIISYLKLVKRQVLVYFLNMKFLILFLVLAISAQPLQAGFCDMDMGKNQETPHHMDMSDSEGMTAVIRVKTILRKAVTVE